VKGIAGKRLLDYLIGALADDLPPGVQTVRTRVGAADGLQIWAVPAAVAADAEYGFWRTGGDALFDVESRGDWLPMGFGSWLPLPRRIRVRVEAAAALEAIQEAVHRLDESWPASDAQVRARMRGGDVVVWFHSPAAGRVPAPLKLPATAFD
jgi:hypothetical protein